MVSSAVKFQINPIRLKYLLDLYKLSNSAFLNLLQGSNKNPTLTETELKEILKSKNPVKRSILNKLSDLFGKNIEWFISKRNLPEKEKLSIFFRKDSFNASLNRGSINLIETFEQKKIKLGLLCDNINYDAKRKLQYSTSDNPQEVAKKIKQLFSETEEKLKTSLTWKKGTDKRNYLEKLIRIIEEFNVFVFEFIDRKKKEELIANFNGFFMGPNVIVIKRQQDYFSREIFTLMHEFGHYLLNIEEIDYLVDESKESLNEVEKWCNDFAYYFLIGESIGEFEELTTANKSNDFHRNKLEQIASKTNLSIFALYTRMKIKNKISSKDYYVIYDEIKAFFAEKKRKEREQLKAKKELAEEAGETFFVASAKPIESKLYKDVLRMNYFEGNISELQVMSSLNVKNKSFEEVIYS